MAQERVIPERVSTTCMVKTKAVAEDGWVVELDVPLFKSQYPTKCTRVNEVVATQLMVGTTQELVLARQSLKKNKGGTYYSDFYWGLGGIANPDRAGAPPTPPTSRGVASPTLARVEPLDPTRVSIERQKSAQIAFDAAQEGELIEATLRRADQIYAWIAGQLEGARPAPTISGPPEAGRVIAKVETTASEAVDGTLTASRDTFTALDTIIKKYGADLGAIKRRYQVSSLADLTEEQAKAAIQWIEKYMGQRQG